MRGKPFHQVETDGLVEVFGESGWCAGSPRQTVHYGPPWRADLGVRRPSMSDIGARLLPRHGPVSDRRRINSDLGCRTTTEDIDTLNGAVGVEHEGAGHRGQRKVEPDIHEDCQEQCSARFHARDFNPSVAGVLVRIRASKLGSEH